MRDYKEDIHIDENDLEREWIEQGSLFLYYAEAHADALYEKDLVKAKLELTYAKMYSDIKKNWERYFDSKPTEPALKEYIVKHSVYRKAERKLIEAVRQANVMLAAKTAFDHRRRALENLVSLRIAGFHSEPRNKTRKINTGAHRAQKESLGSNSRASSRIKRKRRK